MSKSTIKSDDVLQEIQKSRKYAAISMAILTRISEETAQRFTKKKDAVKAAKKQLHMIHELFLTNNCYQKTHAILDESTGKITSSRISQEVCAQIMRLHASTNERLDVIETVYSFLSGYIHSSHTVTDVGCGYNPFGIAFLSELPSAYNAYDISLESIAVINRFFAMCGRTQYRAEPFDAATETPMSYADVLLLFKILPLLQQQRRGWAFAFLMRAQFKIAIVSFPIKSLSGAEKGMLSFYSKFFEGGLPDCLEILNKNVIGDELFYVIQHRPHT